MTATRHRSFRADDELWQAFGVACAAMNRDRSAVLIDYLRWVTHQPGASRPVRPAKPSTGDGQELLR